MKFDAITDPSNTRCNRIELRSEVAGAIQNPQDERQPHRRAGQRPDLAAADEGRHQLLGRVLVRRHRLDAVPGWPGRRTRWPRRTSASSGSARRRPVSATQVSFDYFQLDGPDPSNCEQCDGPGDDVRRQRAGRGALERDRARRPDEVRRVERQPGRHHDRRRDLPGRRPAAARCSCRRPTTPGPTTSSRPS